MALEKRQRKTGGKKENAEEVGKKLEIHITQKYGSLPRSENRGNLMNAPTAAAKNGDETSNEEKKEGLGRVLRGVAYSLWQVKSE